MSDPAASPLLARWRAAQTAELRYHMDVMDVRLERDWHNGIAGLLRLTRAEIADRTVLDVASGPLSLLFDYPPRAGSTALDPLPFGGFEAAYEAAKIERVRTTAEEYAPTQRWDEVWMYNCLQHVLRPDEVVARLTRWARSRIRIFEWIDQPLSEVHLHRIQPGDIAAVLWGYGWQPAYELTGLWHERAVDQPFYAAHWVPLAVPL